METVGYVSKIVLPAAMALLPERMNSPAARALLLAIGLQESRFLYRTQKSGPAEGFWQFESGGGWKGVVSHPATAAIARDVLATMGYGLPDLDDYYAVENNDVLACVFARLLLWSSPLPLPSRADTYTAWLYYLSCWRPGKPHPETWGGFFSHAWSLQEPTP